VFDRRLTHVLGFSVDEHRARRSFLPWSLARLGRSAGEVDTWGTHALLVAGELALYLDHGASFSEFVNREVPGGLVLADVVVDRAGVVVSLAYDPEHEGEPLTFDAAPAA
jgi:hypothetical protein